MALVNKQIITSLPSLYSTEKKPLMEKVAILHFFNPVGRGDWYVFEGEVQECGDILFFGIVDLQNGFKPEQGYFNLEDLEGIDLKFGLKIERDIYFTPTKYSEIKGLEVE